MVIVVLHSHFGLQSALLSLVRVCERPMLVRIGPITPFAEVRDLLQAPNIEYEMTTV